MSETRILPINPSEWPAELLQIRILIAGDDPIALGDVCEGLRYAGFLSIETADCVSALAICSRTPPNILILDLDLFNSKAIEIAKKLSADVTLPIILLSAHEDSKMVSRGIDAGAMVYLVKPADPRWLVPIIWAAVRRNKEFSALRATNAKLTAALHSTRTISVAVGILMERLRLSEQDTFDRLREYARSRNAKIIDLASEILGQSGRLNHILTALAAITS